MSQLIKSQPTAQFLAQLTGKIKLAKEDLKPHAVDLSEKERNGRSMAEGREGIVRLVSKIALAHNESLGKRDNAQELEDRLAYHAQLQDLRLSTLQLLESIDDTQLANSMDCMTMSDRYLGALQNDRKNNSQLDYALREVDEFNKRFGARTEKEQERSTKEESADNQ